jgi:hypothetical protein
MDNISRKLCTQWQARAGSNSATLLLCLIVSPHLSGWLNFVYSRRYIMVRDDSSPIRDECIQCPPGTYSVPIAFASPAPGRLRVLTASSAVALCVLCEVGLACNGGDAYASQPGYFVAGSELLEGGDHRSQGRERLIVFSCPPAACLGNNTCSNGRTGPLCALCSEGYVLTGRQCSPCPSSGTGLDRGTVVAVSVLGAVICLIYAVLVFRLLGSKPTAVPSAGTDSVADCGQPDPGKDRIVPGGFTGLLGCFACSGCYWPGRIHLFAIHLAASMKNAGKAAVAFVRGSGLMSYCKLVISHAQVSISVSQIRYMRIISDR